MKFTSVVSALLAIAGLASAMAIPAPEPQNCIEHPAFYGKGTVYEQQGAYGSCGHQHSDGDIIVALSNVWMNSRSPAPHCGRRIWARNMDTGAHISAKVVDTCMGCNREHVDFSVGAWNQITGGAPWGIFPLEWDFE